MILTPPGLIMKLTHFDGRCDNAAISPIHSFSKARLGQPIPEDRMKIMFSIDCEGKHTMAVLLTYPTYPLPFFGSVLLQVDFNTRAAKGGKKTPQ